MYACRGDGTKRLHHGSQGLIELEYSGFAVDGRPDLGMIVYTPATPADIERVLAFLKGLSGGAGAGRRAYDWRKQACERLFAAS